MEVQEEKLGQEENQGSEGDLMQGKEKRREMKISKEKDLGPNVLWYIPSKILRKFHFIKAQSPEFIDYKTKFSFCLFDRLLSKAEKNNLSEDSEILNFQCGTITQ